MTFKDGVATFKLKNGESVTAEGLPDDVRYTVTETANCRQRRDAAKLQDQPAARNGHLRRE